MVIKQGLSSRWAWADTSTEPDGDTVHPGVAAYPDTTICPRRPIDRRPSRHATSLTLAPVDGTTLIDGATHRVPQQLFTVNEDGTFGGTFPPKKFYELFLKQGTVRLNDPNPAFGSTTVWGFASTVNGDAMVPGPLIQATMASRFWCDIRITCRR